MVEDLTLVPLQAILLADSFTTKFEPITLECPKVLFPLVNTPMLDYTLSWLESADVGEVFVFCCSHSKQIINYLDKSKWVNKKPNFSVTTIESHNCTSVGDALRLIYKRNVIQNDFILVSGDTVSNMNLKQALQEHKERKQKDKNALMTMVIKQSKPCQDELIMAIDPTTKELVYYEDKEDNIKFDKSFLTVNPCLSLHCDKQDCYIDICSLQVLSLLTDNFNYQHLRQHFVKDLLIDDLLSFKIFTHEIHSSCYASRVDNFKSYHFISKDILIQRYNSQAGPFTYIGKDTIIGINTVISNSVVGDGCKIGSNVAIDGCYIWNNVTIQDGCKLRHAILCDGAVMKSGAVLESGVVLSYKVVVGQKFVVPSYSKVSLIPQRVKQDSDKELKHRDDNNLENVDSISDCVVSDIVEDGRGFIWSMSEVDHVEEWKHIVARKRKSYVFEFDAKSDDLEFDTKSDEQMFKKELKTIFLRAVRNHACDTSTFREMELLTSSYNMTFWNCADVLLYLMIKLALDTSNKYGSDLVKVTRDLIFSWGILLLSLSQRMDEKFDFISKFEEMCLESMKEYAPVFVEVLSTFYEINIIKDVEILNWANEKEHADESDKVFVKQSEKFIQWLKENPGSFKKLRRLNEEGVQVRLARSTF